MAKKSIFLNKKEKKQLIIESFLLYEFCTNWELYSLEELVHISSKIDYDYVPDRIIADNVEIQYAIEWDRLNKMKMIRLIARNKKLLDRFDICKFKYSIAEIRHLLKIRPELSDDFKVDYKNLSKEDAFILLELGHYTFLEKIDLDKYIFDILEVFEIIKSHKFDRRVMEKFNLKNLKDYHFAEILIETNDRDLDLIDVSKITPYNWLEVFRNRKNLLKYCGIDYFKKVDIFYTILLLSIFKDEDLLYLIKDRDYKKEISTFGWEELIIIFPVWLNECPADKLDDRSRKRILKKHPKMLFNI